MFKAMIVDDEEDIREGLRDIIDWGKEGYSVVQLAEDGLEALEWYEKIRPDLIVTDIKMPRLDGLELARQVKERNADVRVLIVSGYDEFSYAKKAMKYGIDSYLLKPVDTEELCKELSNIRVHLLEELYAKRSEVLKQEKLKNYFLASLVKADFIEGDAVQEAQRHMIPAQSQIYSVVLVDFQEAEDVELGVDDYQLRAFAIRNVIGEIVEQFQEGVLFDLNKGRLGILVWGDLQQAEERVKLLTEQIKECTPKFTKQEIWIGIGDPVHSFDQIHDSFLQAVSALEMKSYSPVPRAHHGEQLIEEIVKYINQHYSEDLNLRRLSEMFYLNAYYIGKLIKKHYGCSFNEYMNKLRIEQAQHLLGHSNLSIQEIAENVGYHYLNHFYKTFKDILGVSPGEYRKEKWQP